MLFKVITVGGITTLVEGKASGVGGQQGSGSSRAKQFLQNYAILGIF